MNEKIPGGYIILAKKIIDSEIWKKPPLYLKVWIYLLHRAQFKPYKNLERGQLFVTIKDIQDGCAWFSGYRKTVPTKDQIFQIIEWMRKPYGTDAEATMGATPQATTKATMITTAKATHGTLVTIDNYCVYQNPKLYESNDESNDGSNDGGNTADDTGATREQRQSNNINKEGSKKANNGKREKGKDTLAGFPEFYAAYPRKKAPDDARKAWAKINVADHGLIMQALEAHKKSYEWTKDNGQFIPYPATWLRGRRWEDEVKPHVGNPFTMFTMEDEHDEE